jgi:hypothetical protein
MNKLICAHCGRRENLTSYEYKTKTGCTVAVIYLCEMCVRFLKEVRLDFTMDQEKLDKLKEAMELNKEQYRKIVKQ